MKKKNNKKNIRKINKKENGLKQKILEINLSKATIITSTVVIIAIALITAGIITTINESNREKVEVEQEEEYSPVNWIESTEVGEDGNYKKVPVPKGYVASQIEGETTVNGGFVIYEDNYNGKSINWDEIIIKDDSASTENSSASGASVVNEDDGEKEDETNLEMPETSKVTPSEEEQPEQEEITGNNESQASEESSVVDEEGISPEESIQNENEGTSEAEDGVAPVAEREVGETTEPETPATLTAEQQTKKNIFELQKNVNQYVWVPVADISRVCGVDANGKMWGKLYNFNNSGATTLNWTETEGKIGITNKTESYREPDVVTDYNTGYDIDKSMKNYMYGETQYEMLAREMEQSFYETMKSIEKYGGYYIGRYETGIENNKAVVRKMNNNMGNQTWYNMYKKSKELAEENGNVKTSLIWGSQWDETLKWMVESGAKATNGATITYSSMTNSYDWGNHYNVGPFNYIPAGAEEPEATETKNSSGSTRIPTGSAEYTKVNNIYDMAGNVWEWTLEAYSTDGRILRGGRFNINSDYYSVRYRSYSNPIYSGSTYGSRAALIIPDVS